MQRWRPIRVRLAVLLAVLGPGIISILKTFAGMSGP